MNSFLCMEWVRKYGGKELDYTTNQYVVAWIIDTALYLHDSPEDVLLCENARREAQRQINNAVCKNTTSK